MNKDMSASPVKLKDLAGNFDSLNWSRASLVDASSADFDPGFSFKVFVIGTGNVSLVPEDNDNNSENLSQKEKAYFNNVASIDLTAVPAYTEIPILCKKILSAGTTTATILIGK